ncbi:DNA mismatch endonuclease Vsr [Streptomyces subrutilus]|uniref:DNA mismatch endonuclease Vsr n=1 Tax=Streptomyces subrutilus TaxID=36818 RepID=UPI00099F3FD0
MTAERSARQSGWKEGMPPDRAWKGRAGRDREARAAEQDRAAGGREHRYVSVGQQRYALASVELKLLPKTRRIRAYLRWSDGGRSPARYLGQVDQDTRAANLVAGWKLAVAKELVTTRSLPAHSWASSTAVRSAMRANRGRDTRPELRLRSLLHRSGLRYRVSVRPLPDLRRTADLVFTKAHVAVFVDGCYWHGCPDHYRPSTKNADFWQRKIEGNRSRDAETDRRLTEAGWSVVRVWEHEDPAEAARRVLSVVRPSHPTYP